MVAFSAHNHKIGWKKSRPTLIEALNDLYADLGVGNDPVPSIPPVVVPPAITDQDFSLQLLKLRSALGEGSRFTDDRLALEVTEPHLQHQ
jgi:hypothetical protein